MRDYYIELEQQGYLLVIVKVKANNYEEAVQKALRAVLLDKDISEVSKDDAIEHSETEGVNIIDEEGELLSVDELMNE